MPKDFEDCKKRGGRIRTIKHGKNKYQHICYIDNKSYAGEVKTKKKKGK